MSDNSKRAAEAIVYGPLGLLSYLRDTAPSFVQVFVARGRKEFGDLRRTVDARIANSAPDGDRDAAVAHVHERVGQLLTQAGDVVVSAAEVVSALRPESMRAAAPTNETSSAAPEPASAPAAPDEAPNAAEPTIAPVVSLVPEPALAIAGYDGLSAQQVVAHLDGLDRADLERIREYEAAHRGRRTILSKLDQLLA